MNRSTTSVVRVLIALAFAVFTPAPSANAEDSVPRVATVTPIAHSLSTALLRETGIETDFLPPKRLPINRIASWLRKSRSLTFEPYDALVSISDAAPAFAFSTTLRQSNIRLVTIDIAYARLPEGERVVLADPEEFFWLNTNNLLLMLGVLKRDFALMWPEHVQRINENYQRVSTSVRSFNLEVENRLFEHDVAVLVFEKAALKPLAGSLSMDVMTREEAHLMEMPALRIGSTRAPKQPSSAPELIDLYWPIDDLSRYRDEPIEERLGANLRFLKDVLR